jgi:hypothetical protein
MGNKILNILKKYILVIMLVSFVVIVGVINWIQYAKEKANARNSENAKLALSYYRQPPDSTITMEGLLLPHKKIGEEPGYDIQDTMWHVHIRYQKQTGRPIDTTFFYPCNITKNGHNAEAFFGTEKELLDYADRKHIRKFCYKDSVGVEYYIHLKKNENYYLSSANTGIVELAIVPNHPAGWSMLTANEAFWSRDTLLTTGEQLSMAVDADAIIKCSHSQ